MFYTTFKTPMGLMGLAGTSAGLCRVAPQISNESDFVNFLKNTLHHSPIKNPQAFENVVKQFHLYFAGKLQTFTCEIIIDQGTSFQQRTWEMLQTIPFGQTRSYQWLANAVGIPKASRAVGNANGRNPLSIIIPCHRVVHSNGDLGGYTGGIHIKQYLLDLEKAPHGTS